MLAWMGICLTNACVVVEHGYLNDKTLLVVISHKLVVVVFNKWHFLLLVPDPSTVFQFIAHLLTYRRAQNYPIMGCGPILPQIAMLHCTRHGECNSPV